MMDKQTIYRAAALAALAIITIVLGRLCLDADSPATVEIEAPSRTTQKPVVITPAPNATSAPQESVHPESIEPEQADEHNSVPSVTERLGTLTICNKQIPIADNVDERTLEKSPGWMPDSVLPGESGMCVILGHRNRKHLRPLEKVEVGDTIFFTYPDGRTETYIVTETTIYEKSADWRLPSAAGDTLVLVTCWPFRYSGSAPGKYQVAASIIADSIGLSPYVD